MSLLINGSGKDAKALFFIGVRDGGKCWAFGPGFLSENKILSPTSAGEAEVRHFIPP